MRECPGAMAELVFHEWAQLAEGLVVLGNQEQRIVAEPLPAPRLAGNEPAASAGGLEPDRSGRIGQRERAAKGGAPALVGHADHGLEQLAIIGLVVGWLAGIA